jgi:hypothetical protein
MNNRLKSYILFFIILLFFNEFFLSKEVIGASGSNCPDNIVSSNSYSLNESNNLCFRIKIYNDLGVKTISFNASLYKITLHIDSGSAISGKVKYKFLSQNIISSKNLGVFSISFTKNKFRTSFICTSYF